MFCLFINYAHLLTQARFLIRPLGIMCLITDTLYNPLGRKKKKRVIRSCTSKPREIYVLVVRRKKFVMFIIFVFVLGSTTKRLKGLSETAFYTIAM